MRELIQAERDQEMDEHEAQQKLLRDAESIADWLCGECITTAVRPAKPPCSTKSTPSSQRDGFADDPNTSDLLCLLFSSPWKRSSSNRSKSCRAAICVPRACCDAGALDEHRGAETRS